jgi:hypothetical protein
MAELDQTEFKFPDEKAEAEEKASAEQEIVVEVEGEKAVVEVAKEEKPKHSKLGEEPKAPDDKELSEYSERVKNRIDHLYKGYQSEKRRAEQLASEREEALRIAQAIAEENKQLKGSLTQGQSALLEQAKRVVANEVEQAKRKYKEAYESGDADRLVAAQEELTSAKIKLDKVNNFRPTSLQPTKPAVQIPQPAPEPPKVTPDPKATQWQKDNDWFGKDDEMTSFALGYHTKLLKQGVDPTSDDYYEKLNSRMRQVFPEAFDSEEPPERKPQRPKSNVVAPATRSSAPKKIVLTQNQVNIAKRLGIPLEAYARKVAEQMRNES